jgi:hypothetical protein
MIFWKHIGVHGVAANTGDWRAHGIGGAEAGDFADGAVARRYIDCRRDWDWAGDELCVDTIFGEPDLGRFSNRPLGVRGSGRASGRNRIGGMLFTREAGDPRRPVGGAEIRIGPGERFWLLLSLQIGFKLSVAAIH